MYRHLKENITHGTQEIPFVTYKISNVNHEFQIPVHWHEEIELVFIKEGSLYLKIGNEQLSGKKGDVFFVNSKELHLMGSKTGKVEYSTFLFPLGFVCFQTNDLLDRKLLAKVRNGQYRFPAYITDESEKAKIYSICDRISSIDYEAFNISNQLDIKILILQMIMILYDSRLLRENEAINNVERQRDMLNYINEHFTEKLTLSMLANEFGITEKYASRYFSESFNLSFSSYVIHLRLERSRRLLENTEEAVTEVALLSGFQSVGYYIRAFKNAYGISPLKYRNGKK